MTRRHRLYLGAVSALLAGVAFGYGLATGSGGYLWIGCIGLASAGLLMLSGLSWWRTPSTLYDESKREGDRPLLGELLARKYRLITEDELEYALARQQKTHERLGVILVKMGLLTLPQLAGLLEEQLSCQAAPASDPQPQPSPSADAAAAPASEVTAEAG
jgi:hypothetical protein